MFFCFFCFFFFFFFQAEDGIRDTSVTGVSDVCSSDLLRCWLASPLNHSRSKQASSAAATAIGQRYIRSEERRVGKECRSRWSKNHEKKKRINERKWSMAR